MPQKPIATLATAKLDAAPMGAEFPPKKLRLFAQGMNATTKGEFLFDDEAAKKVLAAFEQHGVDLAMDFDHGSLAAPDGRKRDVPGYYRLAVEDGALYALPQWTEAGLAAIKPGAQGELPEYRYTSPTFQYDPATRRVLSMGPLALVSYPATHGAAPMVCSARDHGASAALSMSFGAIAAQLGQAVRARFGWDAEIEDIYPDVLVFALRTPGSADRCLRCAWSMTATGAALGDEAVEVEETYQPIAGGLRIGPAGAVTVAASRTPEESMTMKTVLTALSLPEAASEAEALRALTAQQAQLSALIAATGAKSPAEALGAIEAHKRDALALAALTAQVKAEAEARSKTARAAMLAEGVKAGKVTPAEAKADGEAVCWLSALPNEALASYLATRGVIAPASAAPAIRHPSTGQLTADQATLCASMGIEPAAFLARLAEPAAAVQADDA